MLDEADLWSASFFEAPAARRVAFLSAVLAGAHNVKKGHLAYLR